MAAYLKIQVGPKLAQEYSSATSDRSFYRGFSKPRLRHIRGARNSFSVDRELHETFYDPGGWRRWDLPQPLVQEALETTMCRTMCN